MNKAEFLAKREARKLTALTPAERERLFEIEQRSWTPEQWVAYYRDQEAAKLKAYGLPDHVVDVVLKEGTVGIYQLTQQGKLSFEHFVNFIEYKCGQNFARA